MYELGLITTEYWKFQLSFFTDCWLWHYVVVAILLTTSTDFSLYNGTCFNRTRGRLRVVFSGVGSLSAVEVYQENFGGQRWGETILLALLHNHIYDWNQRRRPSQTCFWLGLLSYSRGSCPQQCFLFNWLKHLLRLVTNYIKIQLLFFTIGISNGKTSELKSTPKNKTKGICSPVHRKKTGHCIIAILTTSYDKLQYQFKVCYGINTVESFHQVDVLS